MRAVLVDLEFKLMLYFFDMVSLGEDSGLNLFFDFEMVLIMDGILITKD